MKKKQLENYNKTCNQILENLQGKPKKNKLLLHICCAPCSSAVLLKLKNYFEITLFYYNPNIAPFSEYKKREAELHKLLSFYKKDFGLNCKMITCEYWHQEFLEAVKGLEAEPEGGKRCEKCYELRLKKTVQKAQECGFNYFCTTLSISPYKNARLINRLGFELEIEKCRWLPNDFKKENGFLHSVQLSKKYNIYRQENCGCEFGN